MFYLGVTKVLCGFIQIFCNCGGILILKAGFDSDTVFAVGILDPEFKTYNIIMVSPGLFLNPIWVFLFCSKYARQDSKWGLGEFRFVFWCV